MKTGCCGDAVHYRLLLLGEIARAHCPASSTRLILRSNSRITLTVEAATTGSVPPGTRGVLAGAGTMVTSQAVPDPGRAWAGLRDLHSDTGQGLRDIAQIADSLVGASFWTFWWD